MILNPIENDKPNLQIGKCYKLRLRHGNSFYGRFFDTTVKQDVCYCEGSIFLLLDIKEKTKTGSFLFHFFIDGKIIIYSCSKIYKFGYTCNFEEID